MRQWKRLMYFLLLNILVSAGTTYAVLMAWDRSHPSLVSGVSANPLPSPTADAGTPAPQGTAAPQPSATQEFIIHYVQPGDEFDSIAATYGVTVEELAAANGFSGPQLLGAGEMLRVPVGPKVAIDSVGAAGDLNLENVTIVQLGGGVLSLEGWQLDNGNGAVFTFPALELATAGARVSVYTKAGANSVDRLYWGLAAPAWESGSIATLRDPQGTERATFTVP